MRSTWLMPFGLVIVALIIVGSLYAWNQESLPRSEVAAYSSVNNGTYTNNLYNYSFTYPSGYQSKQLASVFAEVGKITTNGAFSEQVDVAMLGATVQNPTATFSDFMRLTAQLACNAPGSTALRCGEIATSSPFMTMSGVMGTELYFDSNQGVRGPYFAFDITKNVPTASYAVLLVYPPSNLSGSSSSAPLVQQVASSVQIQ